MSGRLDGRVCVVTGAAGGLGRSIAQRFAAEGARLGIVDLDEVALDGLARELGDGHWSRALDVTDRAGMQAFIEDVVQDAGHLHVLVNNAALIKAGTVQETTEDEFDRVLAVNVKAPFFTIQIALPHLMASGAGAIVNIASISALVGLPGQAAYCTSKGALAQLTRQVAVDYGRHGVRCNAICPGTIKTPLLDEFLDKSPRPEEVREQLLNGHPIGRFADPEEVAAAALFLASDEASFVTGALVSVDGGYVAV